MDILTRRSAIVAGIGLTVSAKRLHAAPKVPRPAPELVLRRTSGELMYLSKLKGKIVVLELLLTTCPHCQRCAGAVQKVLPDYMSKGVTALGAAINDGALQDLLRFEIASGAKFPIGITDRDKGYDFLQADINAGPVYFPQLVLIDRQGVIRAQYGGTDAFFQNEETNLRNMLDTLLRDGAASGGTK